MSDYLIESLDSTPYKYENVKQDKNNIVYTFKDERDHEYKVHIYRRKKYGPKAWVSVIGEKSAGLTSYKRVVGKFHDVKKTLSTLAEIYRHLKEDQKTEIHGILIEIPNKVFEGKAKQLRNLFKGALKAEYTVPDVDFNDEELEKLGFLSVAIIMKPHKYEDVFNVGTGAQSNSTVEDKSTNDFKAKFDELKDESLAYYEEKVKRNKQKWNGGTIKLYRAVTAANEQKDGAYKTEEFEFWTTKSKVAKEKGDTVVEAEIPYTAILTSHEVLEAKDRKLSGVTTKEGDIVVIGKNIKGITGKIYNVKSDAPAVTKTFESYLKGNQSKIELDIEDLIHDEVIDIL